MFKLCVLATLFAVAAAAPGLLPHSSLVYTAPATTTIVQEPGYAKVGTFVKSVPTAVSHQSVSQVHSTAQVVEPVVAPVVKTTAFAAPVLPTYTAGVAGPLLKPYVTPLVHPYSVHSTW